MQEIIYKLDNWTIIKLLGGSTVILTALLVLFSKFFLMRLSQVGKYQFDKKLEDLKGEIKKNNGILDSVVQNYFSTSQKLLDKKIQAYDLLWNSIINIKDQIPSGISIVYTLLIDEEIEKVTAFKDLNNNPKLGPILRSYSIEKDMSYYINNGSSLKPHKPFLSDTSYKLFYTYQGFIGRLTFSFIENYSKSTIYNWKKDKDLESILAITLSDKEIEYIKGVRLNAFTALTDLLEYKILQDIRSNLNIKYTVDDTIEYLKDIEKILSVSKN